MAAPVQYREMTLREAVALNEDRAALTGLLKIHDANIKALQAEYAHVGKAKKLDTLVSEAENDRKQAADILAAAKEKAAALKAKAEAEFGDREKAVQNAESALTKKSRTTNGRLTARAKLIADQATALTELIASLDQREANLKIALDQLEADRAEVDAKLARIDAIRAA